MICVAASSVGRIVSATLQTGTRVPAYALVDICLPALQQTQARLRPLL